METIIVIAIIVLFFAWRMRPVKGISNISTEQLKAIMNDNNKVFVDVRTPAEFKARHIKPFINIPLGSDFSKLPKDKEIVVICQSGMRSKQACNQLKRLGFSKITNVRGGMSAY